LAIIAHVSGHFCKWWPGGNNWLGEGDVKVIGVIREIKVIRVIGVNREIKVIRVIGVNRGLGNWGD
jgi:hypothetical protein